MTHYTPNTELTATQAIRTNTIVPTIVEVMSAYDYIAAHKMTLAELYVTVDSTEAQIAEAADILEFHADIWDDTQLTQTIPAIKDAIIRAESKGG